MKTIAATSLVLVTVIQSQVFSQLGTEACFIDVPTIKSPTEVFSDHISTTLAINGTSVSFEGGTIDIDHVDEAFGARLYGITVSRDRRLDEGGGLVFERGTVELVYHSDSGRVEGLAIDQSSGAHFKDGTLSVSSTGRSRATGVSVDNDFILERGTIEVNAGEGVSYARGISAIWGSTTIINGGIIRVNGGLDSHYARGIQVAGHPNDSSQTATAIIKGGIFEVTTGSPLQPAVFLEAMWHSNTCIFGGSVGNGSNAIELGDNAKLFIFGTGFNLPVNTPITDTAGTITGTLRDGSNIRWSFTRRDENTTIMLVEQSVGDFNGNGVFDSHDLDLLAIQQVSNDPDLALDLTGDGSVGIADRDRWLNEFRRTWFGDFDLDGFFGTQDLVSAMQAGKYQLDEIATFGEGDANGDLRFDTDDLARILAGGGYETATAFPGDEAARPVPEPPGIVLLALAMLSIRSRRLCRTRSQ